MNTRHLVAPTLLPVLDAFPTVALSNELLGPMREAERFAQLPIEIDIHPSPSDLSDSLLRYLSDRSNVASTTRTLGEDMREQDTAAAAAGYVVVSPEMTLLLGAGADAPLPVDAIALCFNLEGVCPTVAFDLEPDFHDYVADQRLIIAIDRAAFGRVGGTTPDTDAFHLPSDLRAIVIAMRDTPLTGETQTIYRLGKSIELLCETIRLSNEGELIALASDGTLSLDDTRRVVAARRLIDERWGEKLTLDKIARACGLNRAKLTRGFRDMFSCTIAEAIAEQRLNQAKRMLITTDKPVSSIGYENGYLNNASFARAFGRRFGLSPSDFRACQMAAA